MDYYRITSKNQAIQGSRGSSNLRSECYTEELGKRLLLPCELCNRTFIPTSLEKHRKGCSSLFKTKRENNNINNSGKNKSGLSDQQISSEHLLAKRRERRRTWRTRHEEFKQAVHSSCDYDNSIADTKSCQYDRQRYSESRFDKSEASCKTEKYQKVKEKNIFPNVIVNESSSHLHTTQSRTKVNIQSNSSIALKKEPNDRQTNRIKSGSLIEDVRYSRAMDLEKNSKKGKPTKAVNNDISRRSPSVKISRKKDDYSRSREIKSRTRHSHTRDTSLSVNETFSAMTSLRDLNANKVPMETKESTTLSQKNVGKCYVNYKRDPSLQLKFGTLSNKVDARNPASGDSKLYNHRPFSCEKTRPVDSKVRRIKLEKNTSRLNKFGDNDSSVSMKEKSGGIIYQIQSFDTKNAISSERSLDRSITNRPRKPNIEYGKSRNNLESSARRGEKENRGESEKRNSTLRSQKLWNNFMQSVDVIEKGNSNRSSSIGGLKVENQFRIPIRDSRDKTGTRSSGRGNRSVSNTYNILQNSNSVNINRNRPSQENGFNSFKTLSEMNPNTERLKRIHVFKRLMDDNNSHGTIDDTLSTRSTCTCKKNGYVRPAYISEKNIVQTYRSSVSLQDSLNHLKKNVNRSAPFKEISHFCQRCGYKFPNSEANFCCSCGRRK